jgi:hypothetical protein
MPGVCQMSLDAAWMQDKRSACVSAVVSYTKFFRCPQTKTSNGSSSGHHAGHATGLPRPIHLPWHALFRWLCIWILKRTGLHMHYQMLWRARRGTSSSNCGRVLTKTEVHFPRQTTGMNLWTDEEIVQQPAPYSERKALLIRSDRRSLCMLWQLKIPSCVNVASSATNTLTAKWRSTAV